MERLRGDFPNSDNFFEGGFVNFKTDAKCYGITTRKNDSGLTVATFEGSSQFGGLLKVDFDNVCPISKKAFLDYLTEQSKRLFSLTQKRDLGGAIFARRKFFLNQLARKIDFNIDTLRALQESRVGPGTGIYVATGVYGRCELIHCADAVKVEPRIDESHLALLLEDLKPVGFGEIPQFGPDGSDASYARLEGYCAYEVPQEALSFVGKYKVLRMSGSLLSDGPE